MAHGVFHKELGAINLSELDLNVREDRLLWESLYGKTVKGDLECLECRENDPGCPRWMFLRLWKGRPVAVHYSTGIRHASQPESPRHRALKERIARAAETAGFSADLEACGPDGRRRTDVLVHGENGLQLGCEVQLSYETAPAVVKRTDIARADGLSPLWTTDDRSAPLIERAPWARIDRLPLEAFSAGNALLVRGGVKDLKLKKCDSHNPLPCPDRGYGRCNQWHGTWAPTLGMHLDRLIAATAAQEYVPLYVPAQPGRRNRASHLWVTAQDHERYLDATSDTLAEPEPGNVDDHDPADPTRIPLSRACSYQQRQEDVERRGRTPRDTTALLPAGITLPHPSEPVPPPAQPVALPAPSAPTQAARPGGAAHTLPPQRSGPATPSPYPPPPASRPDSTPPAVRTAPRPQQDRRAAAVRLGCATEQVGPCASCRELAHRYGPGGNPLCAACRGRLPGC
ncbi:competence protein CoiA family protein [Streptomyces antimycoticus]